MSREFIERNTIAIVGITGNMKEVKRTILNEKQAINVLDEQGELTIPHLKIVFEKLWLLIDDLLKDISRYDYTFKAYETEMNSKEISIWEEYFAIKSIFDKEISQLKEFQKEYKYFEPKNSEELKKQARLLLEKKGYIVDSYFEGDFFKWIGVYARPKDKPTYLDAKDGEEAALQEQYSVNGFKQDFAEWFEFEIVNGEVVES